MDNLMLLYWTPVLASKLASRYQRDPEAVQRWKSETFPAIATEAKSSSAQILFWDESGFRAEVAQAELDAFEASAWGKKFATMVASWRRAGSHVIPFFAFPPQIRRVIYTTNAIESINARLRKIIKTRWYFSNDAASKLIWLALRNITTDWGRAAKDWKEAINLFAILYEDRFTKANA